MCVLEFQALGGGWLVGVKLRELGSLIFTKGGIKQIEYFAISGWERGPDKKSLPLMTTPGGFVPGFLEQYFQFSDAVVVSCYRGEGSTIS